MLACVHHRNFRSHDDAGPTTARRAELTPFPTPGADEQNSRLLMRAAGYGDLQQVRRLLAEGANVDSADELGRTALMQATGAMQLEVMHALLDAGADVAYRDPEGKTVIDIATAMGDHLLAKALASRIAAPSAAGNTLAAAGNTASTAVPTQAKALPLSLLQAAEEQDLQNRSGWRSCHTWPAPSLC